MKKAFLTISLFCLSILILNAQFSAKAGLNISEGNYDMLGKDIKTSPLLGFHAGVVADLHIMGPLNLNTGLIFTQKGVTYEIIDKVSLSLDYLEVPFNLVLKNNVGLGKVFVQAGPYVAFGLSAKKIQEGKDDVTLEFGTADEQIKKVDYGINVGGGIEISTIQLSVNYGMGLGNVLHFNNNDLLYTNRVISFSAAFKF